MIPTVAPNIARDTTNGIVISSLFMTILLFNISTVAGLLQLQRMPQTVGLHLYKLRSAFINCICSFTLVNKEQYATICNANHTYFRYVLPKFPAVWPAFGPVNISGKYRDNAWPAPAENACRVFCRLLIPGITSREIYPALKPAWHWSVFPVALSCKALPVTSYLLY